MSQSTRSIRPSGANAGGFSILELLLAMMVTTVAMASAAAFFHASARFMRGQEREIETTQAVRASMDVMVRELRLGGACLPMSGDYITIDGVNSGTADQIITRTGLTRPDLSCVRTAAVGITPAAGGTINVERADGFQVGMRAYIRNSDGTGEFFTITSVNTTTNVIGRDHSFAKPFAAGSGVNAVDERRFFLSNLTTPWGVIPQLQLQVGDRTPSSFAVGIEALNIKYRLRRNCPPCDVVDLPADDVEWRQVDEVLLTLTARSIKPKQGGSFYRRTMNVSVKPRNLLPN